MARLRLMKDRGVTCVSIATCPPTVSCAPPSGEWDKCRGKPRRPADNLGRDACSESSRGSRRHVHPLSSSRVAMDAQRWRAEQRNVREAVRSLRRSPEGGSPLATGIAAMPLASVIVVCWNAADVLGRCLDQLFAQDYANYEIVVVDRAARGEQITITRSGREVAELRAVAAPALSAEALLRRWRRLPPVEVAAFRRDVDRLLDAGL